MSEHEIREECEMVGRNAEAFLLRQLPPAHAALVGDHLARCGECFGAARAAAAVIGRLARARRLGLAVPPPARRRVAAITADRTVLALVAAGIIGMVAMVYRASPPRGPVRRHAPPAAAAEVVDATVLVDLSAARDRAVAYLLDAQRADGSWRRAERREALDTGLTALSSLALVAAGRTDGEHAAGPLVAARRACEFLARDVPAAGILAARRGPSPAPRAWSVEVQASRALALVHGARLWPETFSAPARAALEELLAMQAPGGAFGVDPGSDGRLGVALAGAAFDAASEVPGLRSPELARAAQRARGALPPVAGGAGDGSPEDLLRRAVAIGRAGAAARDPADGLAGLAADWIAELERREAGDDESTLRMASLLLAMNDGG